MELLSNRPGKINDIVINITIYVRLNPDQEAPYYLFSYQPNEFPLNSTVNKFQLIKNAVYTFILSEDIVDHPFYIGESWNNFSSSLNITSNGTGTNNSLINQGETLNFTYSENFTGVLYYFCLNHSTMIDKFITKIYDI